MNPRFLTHSLFLAAAGLCIALTAAPAFSAELSAPRNSPLGEEVMSPNAIESDAQIKLKKSQYKNVRVIVDNGGVATLSGTVSLYLHKDEAAQRVRKAFGVTAVVNQIEVDSPAISDRNLTDKLGKQLTYDRVGYGNVFNAITMKVENGTVTLGGHARTPWDKDSARRIVETTPGVKNLVDNIQVDPLSSFDDRTRMDLLRAIYGNHILSRYSLDPAKPIRISVQNGVVSLYGTVETEMDKQIAYMQARSVPNVFEVRNLLEVERPAKP